MLVWLMRDFKRIRAKVPHSAKKGIKDTFWLILSQEPEAQGSTKISFTIASRFIIRGGDVMSFFGTPRATPLSTGQDLILRPLLLFLIHLTPSLALADCFFCIFPSRSHIISYDFASPASFFAHTHIHTQTYSTYGMGIWQGRKKA